MCGIIGYSGNSPAFDYLYEGLKRLEYRGYDSAGVYINGTVVKQKGAVDELLKSKVFLSNCGSCGIGHTRWATHGAPSFANAHPHGSGGIYIVHNGIIENSAKLRAELEDKGYAFVSETDTECAVHLIRSLYEGDLLRALKAAARILSGSFAIAAAGPVEGEIAAVRKDSPLIAGIAESGDVHLASDVAAIADKCQRLYALGDMEFLRARPGSLEFFDIDGNALIKEQLIIDRCYESSGLEGYSTFMEKEINEGAAAVERTAAKLTAGEFSRLELSGINRLCFCACGTAYHAGCIGKLLAERFAKIPASAEIASEFCAQTQTEAAQTLYIFISQSGETADTAAAMSAAMRLGARTAAVTNVSCSTLADFAGCAFRTYAGREYAVASTKAYLAQLTFCLKLAQYLCDQKGIDKDIFRPSKVKAVCRAIKRASKDSGIQEVCEAVKGERQVYFLGRGADYLTALEASLKLKEITYIHSEAYPAGELKHGTLALIEQGTRVIAFMTQRELKEKMLSNISEVKARGAHVTVFTQFTDVQWSVRPDIIVKLPPAEDWLMPLVSVVPAQRLACLVSRAKGINCDKPRNLAKSVTVQ